MIPTRTSGLIPELHPLMPLYLVILIAFTGYSMMVTIFVPMLMYDHAFFGGEVSRADSSRLTSYRFLCSLTE